MYEVAKVSVNSWNVDGTPIYEKFIQFRTFRELCKFASGETTTFHIGKGSAIYHNETPLGNLQDLSQWIDERNYFHRESPTLKAWKENMIEWSN